jgi:hypothetical protein
MKNKTMVIVPMAPIFVNVPKLKLKIIWEFGSFLSVIGKPLAS